MAKAIMVQGTASNAGKSLIAAALCRIFKRDGYRVAPFKSQNMALNSFITADGFELGRAQAMQAEAAGIPPDVRMNPVLLKPTGDTGSQVVLMGKPVGTMPATDYYAYKRELRPKIEEAYAGLAAEYDIIVIEGAGSPAEINLKHDDFVNMGMAKISKAPVLLVGDIDRGGVFASLYGTVELVDEDERAMIKGLIINKFRGDVELLRPGLKQIEELTHKPVLGVVPMTRVDIDDEDSLSERLRRSAPGAAGSIDIAVIRLPRLSNFTDFAPLERLSGVTLRYVGAVTELGRPDLVILPGSKSTMADLQWLRNNGLERAIKLFAGGGGIVFGVCGGYQMMGRTLSDPDGVESGGEMTGIGLLPVETVFRGEKTTVQVTGHFEHTDGVFAPLGGALLEGYEIHMGDSVSDTPLIRLSRNGENIADGAFLGNCGGTYVHGLFDSAEVTAAFLSILARRRGFEFNSGDIENSREYKERQYEILADAVEAALDMDAVYKILNDGIEVHDGL